MPVLAVPYLVPFAEAAGIAIGAVASAVGLMELSDRVQSYMEANPENSLKILTLLAPAEGIMALFNKEAGDDEEVIDEEEVEVEDKPKSKKSAKEIVLEEKDKKTGNYASPDAIGNWTSKRGRIIRGLEEEGKVRKGPDPNYDPSTKYQGWKRFVKKGRRNRADGGIMGVV